MSQKSNFWLYIIIVMSLLSVTITYYMTIRMDRVPFIVEEIRD